MIIFHLEYERTSHETLQRNTNICTFRATSLCIVHSCWQYDSEPGQSYLWFCSSYFKIPPPPHGALGPFASHVPVWTVWKILPSPIAELTSFKMNLISPSLFTAAIGRSNRASISQWFSLSLPSISLLYLKMSMTYEFDKLSENSQNISSTTTYWLAFVALVGLSRKDSAFSSLLLCQTTQGWFCQISGLRGVWVSSSWAPKLWSTSKRRYEYKPQWVVFRIGAEVMAMTYVFFWYCLLGFFLLHHWYPAIFLLKRRWNTKLLKLDRMSHYSFVILSKFINNDQIKFESKGTGF